MCFLNSFVLFLIDDCRIRLFLGVLKLRREQLNIIQFWGFYYYIFSLSGFWDQISRGSKSQLLISSFDARVHCVVAMLWTWSQLTGCYIILGWGKKKNSENLLISDNLMGSRLRKYCTAILKHYLIVRSSSWRHVKLQLSEPTASCSVRKRKWKIEELARGDLITWRVGKHY